MEMLMLGSVDPVDQSTLQPAQRLSTTSSTISLEQIEVGPEAVTMGAAGAMPTSTRMALEASLSPQTLLVLAV